MKRLTAWATGLSPRTQDIVLAVALAVYNIGSLLPVAGQLKLPYVAFLLVVLQTLPLIWRRRWPVAVWFAVGIPRTVYDQLGIFFAPLALGPLIAYYTVMERCSTRVRWVISVVDLFGIIRASQLPGHSTYDIFGGALQFAVAGLAGIASRTRQAYLAEVQTRARQAEAERERDVALAAAAERARIARELHDVVAHHVSLIAVQSEAAASKLPGKPLEAGIFVDVIGQTAREALTELRRLLGVLRGPADLADRSPDTAPSPSITRLDGVLRQVRRAGIAVDVRVEGSQGRLAPGVDVAAYRIVQEALTNTIRHSGADEASVTVCYEPGYVTVSVTDTGHGPVAPVTTRTDAARPGGFGLAGIAERVAFCGGSLTVGPGQAGGFAVTARLPTP